MRGMIIRSNNEYRIHNLLIMTIEVAKDLHVILKCIIVTYFTSKFLTFDKEETNEGNERMKKGKSPSYSIMLSIN